MRKLCLMILSLMMAAQMAHAITFTFDPYSVPSNAPRRVMEQNVTKLLNQIQLAADNGGVPDLTDVSMEPEARRRLLAQWEVLPFECDDDDIITKCLIDHQGYQARGILITLRPLDNTYEGSVYRELTVSFSRQGEITGVRPSLENQEDIRRILSEGTDVDDLARRNEILKWVEDFRNYYNERNIASLEQIFSDEALIITGSVVRTRVSVESGMIRPEALYKKKSKTEYINDLRTRVFNTKVNKYINVKFDKISVIKHRSKPNIYGVTLHQAWRTSTYNDDGWLFLLWDFTDPDRPQIQVRTWQDDQMAEDFGIMGLDDLKIY